MYVIIEGLVGIYADEDLLECVVKIGWSSVIGEVGLENFGRKHTKSVKAEIPTTCLLLKKDDFILCDMGAKRYNICSDITTTFPIGGIFTEE